MSLSFDVLAESPASVQQIREAFACADYWCARIGSDGRASLDALEVGDDGTIDVRITQRLGRDSLPGMVTRILPGRLELRYRETWTPVADDVLRGSAEAHAAGLGRSRAQNTLARQGNSAQLRAAVAVEVDLPFVGRQLERMIGESLAGSIPDTMQFTTTWIFEHE